MAAAETARLIAELSLKDKLTPGVKTATASLGKLDTSLGRIGQSAKRGAAVAGKALLGIGAVAAVGIAAGVKSGLESLATLESAVAATDGAIAQMGLTGQVTGQQIADAANEIERSIGAAFDDKDITQATSTLIRFGKVTPKNLRPAMEVMTDLAAKTGSVDSAATLLAKALADPEKAAGKLARQGVILTKAEQDQIKAFMKAGKTADAQKVILDSLAKTTKGAAAATQGPYKRAMSVLADVTEDAQRAIAEGFLPVLERVADWLSKSLADPKVMADIRSMGKSLAGAFDDAVTFAQKVPWGAIKDGLKSAAEWAGRLFDAFRSLPPEFQATIVALAGLNKLSGGAVTGIVAELGKGLIKGVLGINAGVVNINAATVNGAGGVPSAATGAAGTGTGIVGKVGTAVTGVAALGAGAVILQGIKEATDTVSATMAGGDRALEGKLTGLNDLVRSSVGPLETLRRLPDDIGKLAGWITGSGDRTVDAVGALKSDTRSEGIAQRQALAAIKSKTGESITAFRAAERASANQKPPSVSVSTNVKVNVTTNSITRSATIQKRIGGGTGSRDANFHGGNQPI